MKTIIVIVGLLAAAAAAPAADQKGNAMPPSHSPGLRGYRGIWFTLGQYYAPSAGGKAYGPRLRKPTFPYGDKYSGGLGTYTAKHVPLAIYCAKVDKTFFVYGGAKKDKQRYLLCMAGTFDHATGTVTRPTVVHDKGGVDDPHDNPSIAMDAGGYVWVAAPQRVPQGHGFWRQGPPRRPVRHQQGPPARPSE